MMGNSALIMSITFVELSVGLTLIGVNRAILVALLIAIFDILPVLGTGGIMIPWVILSALGGDLPHAFALLVLYVIITVIRNIIEPRIVGAQIGLHPVLTLMSMFVGNHLFGIVGLFGLPIPFVKYASSSIPIILTVLVLKYVYQFFDKIIPQMLKLVFVPMFTALVMCPIALGVTGPIANYISKGIAWLFTGMFAVSPLLAGAVIGATRSLLVFTGMHLSLGAVCLQNITQYGYDYILPVNTMGTLAIVGTCLGVWVKAKKEENKSVAMSAFISSFIGITEPGIYGVLLKYKKALIADIIAGGVAGAFVAVGGGHATAYVNSCILSLPVFVGDGFAFVCIGMAIAAALGFGLVMVMGIDEGGDAPEAAAPVHAEVPAGESITETAAAPADGTLLPLSEVPDNVFAAGTLGKGVAVEPTDGKFYAPFNGTVGTGTGGHAVCLVSDGGVELLIHIGIDTVNLKGKHFAIKVKEGDKVKAGDLLAEVDVAAVRAEGYKTTTPIIVTNSDDYLDVFAAAESGSIRHGDKLLTVIKKG